MPLDDYEFQSVINSLTRIETTDSDSLDRKRFIDPTDPLNAPLPALKFQPTVNAGDPMVSAILGADSVAHLVDEAKAAFNKMDQIAEAEILSQTTDIEALMTSAAIHNTDLGTEIRKIRVAAIKQRAPELLKRSQLLRKAIAPAPLPTGQGVIPNTRPKGSTPTQRKEDLKNLITETLGDVSAFDQETIEALLSAMNAYIEDQIG
jgi:hypothetical protein